MKDYCHYVTSEEKPDPKFKLTIGIYPGSSVISFDAEPGEVINQALSHKGNYAPPYYCREQEKTMYGVSDDNLILSWEEELQWWLSKGYRRVRKIHLYSSENRDSSPFFWSCSMDFINKKSGKVISRWNASDFEVNGHINRNVIVMEGSELIDENTELRFISKKKNETQGKINVLIIVKLFKE